MSPQRREARPPAFPFWLRSMLCLMASACFFALLVAVAYNIREGGDAIWLDGAIAQRVQPHLKPQQARASAQVDPDRITGLHRSGDVRRSTDQRGRTSIDLDRDRCDRNGGPGGAWQHSREAGDHCRAPAIHRADAGQPRAHLPVGSRGFCVVADGDRGDCVRWEAATCAHLAGNRGRHCDRGRHAHLPRRSLVLGHARRSVPRVQRCVCRRRAVARPDRTPS